MSRFEAGEIAIAIGRGEPKECEVIRLTKSLIYRQQAYVIHVPGFPSKRPDGRWVIPERCLRKKKPPKEEEASWEEIKNLIGWNPTKEKEHV